jgi:hypothetical protein
MISMSRAVNVYRHQFNVASAPEPAQAARYERIDWASMREDAARGIVPNGDERLGTRRPALFKSIRAAARAGDLATLTAMEVGGYNSTTKGLIKYRDICIAALQARQAVRS